MIYDYNEIANDCLTCSGWTPSLEDILTIQHDLARYCLQQIKVLQAYNWCLDREGGHEYTSFEEVREAILNGRFLAPVMESCIGDDVYSRYRALHDIKDHGISGLGFDWLGESLAWVINDQALAKMGASVCTRKFVQHDILGINALYHHFNGSIPTELQGKVRWMNTPLVAPV